MIVRRLIPGEGALYREARLRSLLDSPEAFATTHEAASQRDAASWAAQADSSATGGDRATFIVPGDPPLGLAAVYRDTDHPSEGELLQVWISPELRGGDTALRLMDTVWSWVMENGFSLIRAEVKTGNLRALRFYEKYGFHPTEDKPCADDSVMLVKPVRTPSAS
ncbi:GNAT family N-acetyltransferase [Luteolibacter sp. SL250]|uniref:GNAT family N-acetyltransferase n=1 Tax=Luteolibacter sp. SL250 TaxID=2995170 RepID=UPI00227130C6|nr:GNAT family N-acetyltransferase [Luteolibacter sp. SL250]WAC21793.1 GNAT family N-acetyltransferase [Luteolibacter sp. SL250]